MKFLCVFKKELRVYFGSFIAYALASAFLVLAGYFFYTDLIFYNLFGDFSAITTSLWHYYFLDLRFVSLLILPFCQTSYERARRNRVTGPCAAQP